MNARVVMILGLTTVVAVALALVLVERAGNESTTSSEPALLPALSERVNAIEALEIIGTDGETVATLHRARERWRMQEKHDYEADFARIHDLLRELARARRLEARTDNPDWYGRLGVATPGDGEGSGVAVRFPGTDLPGLIVGRPDPAGIGRYVRLEEGSRAWLTGQDLDLPAERMEWLERAIMDIPAADIRAVTIRHPDGDEVEIRPGDEEGITWVMLDPPAGREVKPAWQLRQTASVLAQLNMEDVRPHEPAILPEDAVEAVFRTRDGMVFTARTFSDEDGNWVHFRVSEDESSDRGEAPAESQTRVDNDETAEAQEDPGGATMTEQELDVVAVDGRLAPWQFAISEDRYERFRPTTAKLLVAPEETEE